jgi:transcriptional regulator with PAS, ATPase and Fis domain
MKAAELDLRELLHFDPQGGVIRFGGERALLFDAVALGQLRKELIDTLGLAGARAVLSRFGFAHGWRTAQSLKTAYPWDNEDEWKRAGGRLHTLQGLVVVASPFPGPRTEPEPFGESIWHESYEAEQHLLHRGQSEEPVCWTLAGYASGYLSYCNGREIYAIETRCRGKGDPVCHVVARYREDWGAVLAPHLPFYKLNCLNEVLGELSEELKRVERRLQARRKELSLGPSSRTRVVAGLIVQSEAMERVVDLATRVSRVDSTVLITGESGVGKERVARLIHEESARAGGPFVAINCGAVPEGLLESELFGHARGAFTGATQDRPGLFEAANGGTLLLDEVGDVPPAMQVKLLRALQEREVRRVGENKTRKVDVRVLAATNRDLAADVHSAKFRQDLYYRLRVVELRVPPLRERRADILPLARAFLVDAAKRTGRRITGLTPGGAQQLVRYHWPGNVRELENAIEHAVVLARGTTIDAGDLPEEVGLALPSTYAAGEVRPLAEVERDYILAVLRATNGNKVKAAEQLDIGTATLYRKLKEYQTA